MSQIVKLRRSSVSGQKPTNANLQLGELALNTTDGKVYMSVSGSLGPTVEELISTNTVNTGSVNISGSLNLTGTETITGSLNVTDDLYVSGNIFLGTDVSTDRIVIKSWISSSIIPSDDSFYYLGQPVKKWANIYSTTASFNRLMGITGGTLNISNASITGSMTGSFKGDGSQLFNLPYSGLTNVPTLVSGSSQISYTGITDIPNGIVSGSQQVADLGFTTTSSFNTFTSSYTTVSSSFDSRINAITGSISGINTSLSYIELFSSSINNFTSSVVLTSQTSSMTVLSSSYALTASYALNGGSGGSEGQTAKLIQTTPNTTWTFVHNLGEQFPAITIFDSNDDVVIPTSVNAQDDNTLIITFSSPQTGTASATVGGGLPYISGSYQGRVLAVDNNAPIWKGGILSGSLQIFNLGFATTGSNVFNGDQHISGSLTIGDSAEIGSKCVTISNTTQLFDLSIFNGANFDYVVKNGLNMRAGAIMSAWNGTNAVYNESSTMDLGNTSGVTFNVTSTGQLNAVITNGSWSIQVLYRALGCGLIYPTPTPPPNQTATPTPTPTSTPNVTPTPTPVATNYMISATGSTAPNYCDGLGGPFTVSVYGNNNVWTSVTRFYTDSGMTIPFNGYHLYYGDSTAYFGTTLQIDPSGYVTDFYAC